VNHWLIIVVIGAGTYLTRISFIAALGRRGVPAVIEAPLRYVAPAVLAAIAIPAIVTPGGGPVDLTPANLRLVAAVVAGGVAWKTRNIGLTIVVGLVILGVLDFLT
jgi:branched-subunit amino acid transport protein